MGLESTLLIEASEAREVVENPVPLFSLVAEHKIAKRDFRRKARRLNKLGIVEADWRDYKKKYLSDINNIVSSTVDGFDNSFGDVYLVRIHNEDGYFVINVQEQVRNSGIDTKKPLAKIGDKDVFEERVRILARGLSSMGYSPLQISRIKLGNAIKIYKEAVSSDIQDYIEILSGPMNGDPFRGIKMAVHTLNSTGKFQKGPALLGINAAGEFDLKYLSQEQSQNLNELAYARISKELLRHDIRRVR